MKLLQLTIDNRWSHTPENNEFELVIGDNRESAQKFNFKPTDELCARVMEVLMPEVTTQISAMFESLVGDETVITDEMAEETLASCREPFLSTDDE